MIFARKTTFIFFIHLINFQLVAQEKVDYSFLESQSSAVAKINILISGESYKGVYREYMSDVYYPAQLLLPNGDTLSIEMRVRGDSSRERSKKSLKIKLPTDQPKTLDLNKLNLNAEASDPSYLHQYLAAHVYANSGQPSFDTHHVLLYFNGEFNGIYLMIENMDEQFLSRNDLDPTGNLYKATYDGATLSSHDDILLNWEKKTNAKNESMSDLVQLKKDINSVSDEDYYSWVQTTFDYKNLINSLAVNMLISNSSTYYHNYFLFHDLKRNKWLYIPWDMDETFNESYIDMHYTRGSWAERKSSEMEGNPLLERALINPKILKDIRVRIDELHTDLINSAYLNPIIDGLAKELIPFTGSEMNTNHSRASFETELKNIKQFISERYTNLTTQFENSPSSFRINQPTAPFQNDVVLTWEPSIDPKNKALNYSLTYSKDQSFDSRSTINNIVGTTCTIPASTLSGDKYYFKVSVSNGEFHVYGYDSQHFFMKGVD